MTNCNTKQIEFKGIKSKKVETKFTAGKLTSDAGLLLLRQAEERTQLLERIAGCIWDSRNQDMIVHEIKTMLKQRVYGIACGYEDLNDQDQLRKDALFKIANNMRTSGDGDLASSPTICRMEKRITRKELGAIAGVMVDQFIASYKKAPKEMILDFDATDDEIHGNQEGKFFHGYYDHYCYLPLYVFCNKRLVVSYLRPAKIDAAKHAWAILALLVKRIREVFPAVKIIFRGDSGFCRRRILSWCEHNDVYYTVGIAKNARLETVAQQIIEQSRQQYEQTQEKVRLFGEVQYGARSWKGERRVIVKAEQLVKGENIRYVVTNLTQEDEKYIYDKKYVKRGDMENRIKEQQLDLFADRTSCHKFLSNQLRLFLASLAYILLDYIRQVGLKGTRLVHAYCGTLRMKLLKVGAIISENSRRIRIEISQFYVYRDYFRLIAMRLSG